jgi:hypothetical protein
LNDDRSSVGDPATTIGDAGVDLTTAVTGSHGVPDPFIVAASRLESGRLPGATFNGDFDVERPSRIAGVGGVHPDRDRA